jgi:hypothetical protein
LDLFAAERKYDATEDIKPVHRVLVPPFVFLIKKIIHLYPQVQLTGDPELDTCIQVESAIPFKVLATGGPVLGAVKGE